MSTKTDEQLSNFIETFIFEKKNMIQNALKTLYIPVPKPKEGEEEEEYDEDKLEEEVDTNDIYLNVEYEFTNEIDDKTKNRKVIFNISDVHKFTFYIKDNRTELNSWYKFLGRLSKFETTMDIPNKINLEARLKRVRNNLNRVILRPICDYYNDMPIILWDPDDSKYEYEELDELYFKLKITEDKKIDIIFKDSYKNFINYLNERKKSFKKELDKYTDDNEIFKNDFNYLPDDEEGNEYDKVGKLKAIFDNDEEYKYFSSVHMEGDMGIEYYVGDEVHCMQTKFNCLLKNVPMYGNVILYFENKNYLFLFNRYIQDYTSWNKIL